MRWQTAKTVPRERLEGNDRIADGIGSRRLVKATGAFNFFKSGAPRQKLIPPSIAQIPQRYFYPDLSIYTEDLKNSKYLKKRDTLRYVRSVQKFIHSNLSHNLSQS